MEAIADYDEFGYVLKWCFWCKNFEPAYQWKDKWYCATCGREWDYYRHLEEISGIDNEY